MVIWECETKDHEAVAARIESFLRRDESEPVEGWGMRWAARRALRGKGG